MIPFNYGVILFTIFGFGHVLAQEACLPNTKVIQGNFVFTCLQNGSHIYLSPSACVHSGKNHSINSSWATPPENPGFDMQCRANATTYQIWTEITHCYDQITWQKCAVNSSIASDNGEFICRGYGNGTVTSSYTQSTTCLHNGIEYEKGTTRTTTIVDPIDSSSRSVVLQCKLTSGVFQWKAKGCVMMNGTTIRVNSITVIDNQEVTCQVNSDNEQDCYFVSLTASGCVDSPRVTRNQNEKWSNATMYLKCILNGLTFEIATLGCKSNSSGNKVNVGNFEMQNDGSYWYCNKSYVMKTSYGAFIKAQGSTCTINTTTVTLGEYVSSKGVRYYCRTSTKGRPWLQPKDCYDTSGMVCDFGKTCEALMNGTKWPYKCNQTTKSFNRLTQSEYESWKLATGSSVAISGNVDSVGGGSWNSGSAAALPLTTGVPNDSTSELIADTTLFMSELPPGEETAKFSSTVPSDSIGEFESWMADTSTPNSESKELFPITDEFEMYMFNSTDSDDDNVNMTRISNSSESQEGSGSLESDDTRNNSSSSGSKSKSGKGSMKNSKNKSKSISEANNESKEGIGGWDEFLDSSSSSGSKIKSAGTSSSELQEGSGEMRDASNSSTDSSSEGSKSSNDNWDEFLAGNTDSSAKPKSKSSKSIGSKSKSDRSFSQDFKSNDEGSGEIINLLNGMYKSNSKHDNSRDSHEFDATLHNGTDKNSSESKSSSKSNSTSKEDFTSKESKSSKSSKSGKSNQSSENGSGNDAGGMDWSQMWNIDSKSSEPKSESYEGSGNYEGSADNLGDSGGDHGGIDWSQLWNEHGDNNIYKSTSYSSEASGASQTEGSGESSGSSFGEANELDWSALLNGGETRSKSSSGSTHDSDKSEESSGGSGDGWFEWAKGSTKGFLGMSTEEYGGSTDLGNPEQNENGDGAPINPTDSQNFGDNDNYTERWPTDDKMTNTDDRKKTGDQRSRGNQMSNYGRQRRQKVTRIKKRKQCGTLSKPFCEILHKDKMISPNYAWEGEVSANNLEECRDKCIERASCNSSDTEQCRGYEYTKANGECIHTIYSLQDYTSQKNMFAYTDVVVDGVYEVFICNSRKPKKNSTQRIKGRPKHNWNRIKNRIMGKPDGTNNGQSMTGNGKNGPGEGKPDKNNNGQPMTGNGKNGPGEGKPDKNNNGQSMTGNGKNGPGEGKPDKNNNGQSMTGNGKNGPGEGKPDKNNNGQSMTGNGKNGPGEGKPDNNNNGQSMTGNGKNGPGEGKPDKNNNGQLMTRNGKNGPGEGKPDKNNNGQSMTGNGKNGPGEGKPDKNNNGQSTTGNGKNGPGEGKPDKNNNGQSMTGNGKNGPGEGKPDKNNNGQSTTGNGKNGPGEGKPDKNNNGQSMTGNGKNGPGEGKPDKNNNGQSTTGNGKNGPGEGKPDKNNNGQSMTGNGKNGPGEGKPDKNNNGQPMTGNGKNDPGEGKPDKNNNGQSMTGNGKNGPGEGKPDNNNNGQSMTGNGQNGPGEGKPDKNNNGQSTTGNGQNGPGEGKPDKNNNGQSTTGNGKNGPGEGKPDKNNNGQSMTGNGKNGPGEGKPDKNNNGQSMTGNGKNGPGEGKPDKNNNGQSMTGNGKNGPGEGKPDKNNNGQSMTGNGKNGPGEGKPDKNNNGQLMTRNGKNGPGEGKPDKNNNGQSMTGNGQNGPGEGKPDKNNNGQSMTGNGQNGPGEGKPDKNNNGQSMTGNGKNGPGEGKPDKNNNGQSMTGNGKNGPGEGKPDKNNNGQSMTGNGKNGPGEGKPDNNNNGQSMTGNGQNGPGEGKPDKNNNGQPMTGNGKNGPGEGKPDKNNNGQLMTRNGKNGPGEGKPDKNNNGQSMTGNGKNGPGEGKPDKNNNGQSMTGNGKIGPGEGKPDKNNNGQPMTGNGKNGPGEGKPDKNNNGQSMTGNGKNDPDERKPDGNNTESSKNGNNGKGPDEKKPERNNTESSKNGNNGKGPDEKKPDRNNTESLKNGNNGKGPDERKPDRNNTESSKNGNNGKGPDERKPDRNNTESSKNGNSGKGPDERQPDRNNTESSKNGNNGKGPDEKKTDRNNTESSKNGNNGKGPDEKKPDRNNTESSKNGNNGKGPDERKPDRNNTESSKNGNNGKGPDEKKPDRNNTESSKNGNNGKGPDEKKPDRNNTESSKNGNNGKGPDERKPDRNNTESSKNRNNGKGPDERKPDRNNTESSKNGDNGKGPDERKPDGNNTESSKNRNNGKGPDERKPDRNNTESSKSGDNGKGPDERKPDGNNTESSKNGDNGKGPDERKPVGNNTESSKNGDNGKGPDERKPDGNNTESSKNGDNGKGPDERKPDGNNTESSKNGDNGKGPDERKPDGNNTESSKNGDNGKGPDERKPDRNNTESSKNGNNGKGPDEKKPDRNNTESSKNGNNGKGPDEKKPDRNNTESSKNGNNGKGPDERKPDRNNTESSKNRNNGKGPDERKPDRNNTESSKNGNNGKGPDERKPDGNNTESSKNRNNGKGPDERKPDRNNTESSKSGDNGKGPDERKPDGNNTESSKNGDNGKGPDERKPVGNNTESSKNGDNGKGPDERKPDGNNTESSKNGDNGKGPDERKPDGNNTESSKNGDNGKGPDERKPVGNNTESSKNGDNGKGPDERKPDGNNKRTRSLDKSKFEISLNCNSLTGNQQAVEKTCPSITVVNRGETIRKITEKECLLNPRILVLFIGNGMADYEMNVKTEAVDTFTEFYRNHRAITPGDLLVGTVDICHIDFETDKNTEISLAGHDLKFPSLKDGEYTLNVVFDPLMTIEDADSFSSRRIKLKGLAKSDLPPSCLVVSDPVTRGYAAYVKSTDEMGAQTIDVVNQASHPTRYPLKSMAHKIHLANIEMLTVHVRKQVRKLKSCPIEDDSDLFDVAELNHMQTQNDVMVAIGLKNHKSQQPSTSELKSVNKVQRFPEFLARVGPVLSDPALFGKVKSKMDCGFKGLLRLFLGQQFYKEQLVYDQIKVLLLAKGATRRLDGPENLDIETEICSQRIVRTVLENSKRTGKFCGMSSKFQKWFGVDQDAEEQTRMEKDEKLNVTAVEDPIGAELRQEYFARNNLTRKMKMVLKMFDSHSGGKCSGSQTIPQMLWTVGSGGNLYQGLLRKSGEQSWFKRGRCMSDAQLKQRWWLKLFDKNEQELFKKAASCLSNSTAGQTIVTQMQTVVKEINERELKLKMQQEVIQGMFERFKNMGQLKLKEFNRELEYQKRDEENSFHNYKHGVNNGSTRHSNNSGSSLGWNLTRSATLNGSISNSSRSGSNKKGPEALVTMMQNKIRGKRESKIQSISLKMCLQMAAKLTNAMKNPPGNKPTGYQMKYLEFSKSQGFQTAIGKLQELLITSDVNVSAEELKRKLQQMFSDIESTPTSDASEYDGLPSLDEIVEVLRLITERITTANQGDIQSVLQTVMTHSLKGELFEAICHIHQLTRTTGVNSAEVHPIDHLGKTFRQIWSKSDTGDMDTKSKLKLKHKYFVQHRSDTDAKCVVLDDIAPDFVYQWKTGQHKKDLVYLSAMLKTAQFKELVKNAEAKIDEISINIPVDEIRKIMTGIAKDISTSREAAQMHQMYNQLIRQSKLSLPKPIVLQYLADMVIEEIDDQNKQIVLQSVKRLLKHIYEGYLGEAMTRVMNLIHDTGFDQKAYNPVESITNKLFVEALLSGLLNTALPHNVDGIKAAIQKTATKPEHGRWALYKLYQEGEQDINREKYNLMRQNECGNFEKVVDKMLGLDPTISHDQLWSTTDEDTHIDDLEWDELNYDFEHQIFKQWALQGNNGPDEFKLLYPFIRLMSAREILNSDETQMITVMEPRHINVIKQFWKIMEDADFNKDALFALGMEMRNKLRGVDAENLEFGQSDLKAWFYDKIAHLQKPVLMLIEENKITYDDLLKCLEAVLPRIDDYEYVHLQDPHMNLESKKEELSCERYTFKKLVGQALTTAENELKTVFQLTRIMSLPNLVDSVRENLDVGNRYAQFIDYYYDNLETYTGIDSKKLSLVGQELHTHARTCMKSHAITTLRLLEHKLADMNHFQQLRAFSLQVISRFGIQDFELSHYFDKFIANEESLERNHAASALDIVKSLLESKRMILPKFRKLLLERQAVRGVSEKQIMEMLISTMNQKFKRMTYNYENNQMFRDFIEDFDAVCREHNLDKNAILEKVMYTGEDNHDALRVTSIEHVVYDIKQDFKIIQWISSDNIKLDDNFEAIKTDILQKVNTEFTAENKLPTLEDILRDLVDERLQYPDSILTLIKIIEGYLLKHKVTHGLMKQQFENLNEAIGIELDSSITDVVVSNLKEIVLQMEKRDLTEGLEVYCAYHLITSDRLNQTKRYFEAVMGRLGIAALEEFLKSINKTELRSKFVQFEAGDRSLIEPVHGLLEDFIATMHKNVGPEVDLANKLSGLPGLEACKNRVKSDKKINDSLNQVFRGAEMIELAELQK